jgi:SAM-dependent methyltransferase
VTADPLGRALLSGRATYPVERYFDRLLRRLDLAKGGGRALDAGCGDGLVSAWLAAHGWDVAAEDMEPHPAWPGLAAAAAAGRLRFGLRDAGAGGGDGGFDLVLTKDMLHHAADPVAALTALRGRVRPGGRLVVVECNRLNPVFYVHLTLMGNHQHFTRERLLGLLGQAGLGDARLERIEARVWPLGGPALQNAFDRLQDLAEAAPFWRPFICYHAAAWTRPQERT